MNKSKVVALLSLCIMLLAVVEASCAEYTPVKWKDVARDPDSYKGKRITFTGKVDKVFDDDSFIARQDGNRKFGWYVEYSREAGVPRILDGDKVEIFGIFTGDFLFLTDYPSVIAESYKILD